MPYDPPTPSSDNATHYRREGVAEREDQRRRQEGELAETRDSLAPQGNHPENPLDPAPCDGHAPPDDTASPTIPESIPLDFFDTISLGVALLDSDGRTLRINEELTNLTGYTPSDVPDLETWFAKAYPDTAYRREIREVWLADMHAPTNAVREASVTCKDGTVKRIEFRAAFQPDGVSLVTMTDVSERFEAARAVRESEERFRALSRATTEAIFISDKGVCIDANEAASTMFGYPREELIGIVGTEVIAPGWREQVREHMLSDYEHPYEALGLRKDGSTFPAMFHGRVFLYRGSLIRATTVRDLTEQKEAEQRILEREQRLSVIFQNSPLGMILFDSEGTIIDCNNRFVLLMGSSREKLIGFNTARESDNPDMRRAIRQALSGKATVFEDEYTSTTGGETSHIRVVFNPVHPDQSPTHVIATLEDVSERLQAEKMLRESEQRYRQLFENTSSGIFLHDLIYDGKGAAVDYVITDVNPAGLAILGVDREQLVNKPATEAYGVDTAPYIDIYTRIAATGRPEHFETYFQPMKKHFHVLAYSFRTGSFATVFDDITERKRMEETMVQTEKMMSVGGLAAGMAHEINNPLAGILGSVQVIQQRLTAPSPKNSRLAEDTGLDLNTLNSYIERQEIPRLLETVREAGLRASTIVNDMLSFSRKGGEQMAACDAGILLDRALELASRDYDLKRRFDFRNIAIFRQYDPELPPVVCDANQIQQVLLNILSNGAQAMATKEYGPGEKPSFHLSVRKSRGDIRISLRDNGPGMEESVRKRIFEPFFTTKEAGTGTGLGLSVSYFIITRNHGGRIHCESTPGEGTEFIVLLPAAPPIAQT